MPIEYAVVCPATRGIGLAMTRHLLRTTKLHIVGTARQEDKIPSYKDTILKDLPPSSDRLSLFPLDVTKENKISNASSQLREKFQDKDRMKLFLSFPGVLYPERSPEKMELSQIKESFDVNVIGHLLLMKHFGDLILPPRKHRPNSHDNHTATTEGNADVEMPNFPIWACMSARVGSTTDNYLGGWWSYRASKAAVTSAVKSFDIHLQTSHNTLKSQDTTRPPICVGLHPGTTKTELSKGFWESVQKNPEHKLFEPDQAAGNLWKVLCAMKEEQRGKVWDWKGEEVPP